jgi:hypothetical protein
MPWACLHLCVAGAGVRTHVAGAWFATSVPFIQGGPLDDVGSGWAELRKRDAKFFEQKTRAAQGRGGLWGGAVARAVGPWGWGVTVI